MGKSARDLHHLSPVPVRGKGVGGGHAELSRLTFLRPPTIIASHAHRPTRAIAPGPRCDRRPPRRLRPSGPAMAPLAPADRPRPRQRVHRRLEAVPGGRACAALRRRGPGSPRLWRQRIVLVHGSGCTADPRSDGDAGGAAWAVVRALEWAGLAAAKALKQPS